MFLMTSQCYRFIPRLRSRQIPFLSLLFPNNSVCTEVVLIKMYELPLCEWMRLFFTKSLTLSFSLALSGLRCIVVGTCVRSRLHKRGAVDTGACGSQTFSLLSETSQSKTMRASTEGCPSKTPVNPESVAQNMSTAADIGRAVRGQLLPLYFSLLSIDLLVPLCKIVLTVLPS